MGRTFPRPPDTRMVPWVTGAPTRAVRGREGLLWLLRRPLGFGPYQPATRNSGIHRGRDGNQWQNAKCPKTAYPPTFCEGIGLVAGRGFEPL